MVTHLPRLLLLLLSSLLLTISPALAGADKPLISGNIYSPPIMWKKSGTITGVGPRIVELIFKELQQDYSLEDLGNWEEVQQLTRAGAIDLLVGAYRNTERQGYLLFSDPYFPEPVSLLMKKDATFTYNSWHDLIGKKGVTQFGESYGTDFDAFMAKNLEVERSSMKGSFDQLLSGQADYLIIDFFKGINYSRMLRRQAEIHFVDKPLLVEHLCLAVSKDSPLASQLPKINASLRRLKKQGVLQELIKEANQQFDQAMQARERLFKRARRDVAAAPGPDSSDRPDFHQRYQEAIGGAVYLAQ